VLGKVDEDGEDEEEEKIKISLHPVDRVHEDRLKTDREREKGL